MIRPAPIKMDPGWYWVRRIANYKRDKIVSYDGPFIPAMFSDAGTFHYLDICSFDGMHPDEFELGPRIAAPDGMRYDGKGYMIAVYVR